MPKIELSCVDRYNYHLQIAIPFRLEVDINIDKTGREFVIPVIPGYTAHWQCHYNRRLCKPGGVYSIVPK